MLLGDQQEVFALVDSTRLGPLLSDQFRKSGLESLVFLDGGALRLAGPALPTLFQPQPVAAVAGLGRQGVTFANLPEDQRRKAHDQAKAAVAAALKNAERSILDTVLAYAG